MPIPKTVEQIVEIITSRIAKGVDGYKPGDRLPTYPQLAEELPASVATVGRAIRELREAGLLVGVRGEGVWVAERRTTDG